MVELPDNHLKHSTYLLFALEVTYQNNSWDCGVFVCRYASGIFQLRDRVFSYNELLGERGDVIKMITYGDEFNFSLDDIADLREEMKILIERLSTIYLPWRAKVDQEEIFEKIVESKAKSDPNASSQESGSGSQLLPTPRPSTDECTDMHPCLLKEGIHHDSPNSLVTQHDFGAFENRIAKENVDTEPKRSRISETTGVSKDYGARHVDKSPSHWRHVADEQRASLSNFNSEQLDAASI